MPHPIRQNVSQIKGITRTDRGVLTHVAELAEHGGKGHCYASNNFLGRREQATPRTISRVLGKLQRLGLLVISGQTSDRRIVPSPLLRRCYAGESTAACAAATAALSEQLLAGNKGPCPDTLPLDNHGTALDKPDPELETTRAPALDNSGRAYKETRIHEQENEQNEKASLRAALDRKENELAEAQKKIDALTTQRAALETEMVSLTAQCPAAHTKGAAGVALRYPTWATDGFYAQWTEWVGYRQRKRNKLSPASLQKTLDQLAAFDAGFCQLLFDKAIAGGYTGLVFDDTALKFAHYLHPSPSLYHHANPSSTQSPERGAKPSAHAAGGARALSAHLRTLREQGNAHERGPLHLCQATGLDPGQG